MAGLVATAISGSTVPEGRRHGLLSHEDRGGPDVRFTITTKRGAEVTVYAGPSYSGLPYGDRIALKEQEFRGQAVAKRRGVDLSYNCHGMTFAGKLGWIGDMGRRADAVLLGDPGPDRLDTERDIESLLRANAYQLSCTIENRKLVGGPCPSPPEVGVGDIVLYLDVRPQRPPRVSHSGTIVALQSLRANEVSEIIVLSKFGMLGEYTHPFRTVPEAYGLRVEFWTDREVGA